MFFVDENGKPQEAAALRGDLYQANPKRVLGSELGARRSSAVAQEPFFGALLPSYPM